VLFLIFPDLDLASAIALGAVLSPTDAVSATSVAKRIGLPSRVVTVLEGESLVNDATTLVLLRTAMASIAAVFHIEQAVGDFVWATVGGLIVGGIVGVLASAVRKGFRDPVLVTSISFAIPFFAYAPAEAMNASGVIAVVTTGLIVGHRSVRTQTVQLRLVEQTNWRTLQFLLENGVFLLLGYQLREYIADDIHQGYQPGYTILLGLLAVVILVAVRLAFVFPIFSFLNRRSAQIAAGRASTWAGCSACAAARARPSARRPTGSGISSAARAQTGRSTRASSSTGGRARSWAGRACAASSRWRPCRRCRRTRRIARPSSSSRSPPRWRHCCSAA
jgi:CPA1 family monovalent cation:H+ antiporter